jgi:hypothetical protein
LNVGFSVQEEDFMIYESMKGCQQGSVNYVRNEVIALLDQFGTLQNFRCHPACAVVDWKFCGSLCAFN